MVWIHVVEVERLLREEEGVVGYVHVFLQAADPLRSLRGGGVLVNSSFLYGEF